MSGVRVGVFSVGENDSKVSLVLVLRGEDDNESLGRSDVSVRPRTEGNSRVGEVWQELDPRTGVESEGMEPVRMSKSKRLGEGWSLSLSRDFLCLECWGMVGRTSVMGQCSD